MRSIQSKTLATFGTIIASAVSLAMPLVSPSLAAGGGSHKTLRMCAKVEYTYKAKDGRVISGVTPVECGKNVRQQHNESGLRKASREEACKKAWQHLPRLEQGAQWLQRSCKPYQQK
ncbi:hypothetical protein [Microseira sp. BLCC-F43]|jgi:hypothetical protein|uniref:hypothetical protein n=1 Tax=Microseira sp. BLCC-F43 TaxID=3153602 RepID=UPI0035BB1D47